MFGLSITKLLFTAGVIFLVWNAFKYFTRMQEQRAQNERVKSPKRGANPASSDAPTHNDVEDMVECKVCGAFVTTDAKSCGKDKCPF